MATTLDMQKMLREVKPVEAKNVKKQSVGI
jgi:hypothetical protein